MSCIIGAIMYCAVAMHIPGPVGHARTYIDNAAWRYAAYWQPPILNWTPAVNPRRG